MSILPIDLETLLARHWLHLEPSEMALKHWMRSLTRWTSGLSLLVRRLVFWLIGLMRFELGLDHLMIGLEHFAVDLELCWKTIRPKTRTNGTPIRLSGPFESNMDRGFVSKESMYVILDSSAIIPDYWYRRPQLQTLLNECYRIDLQLAAPMVVIDELVRRLSEKVEKEKADLQSLDELVYFEVFLTDDAYDVIDKTKSQYRDWLKRLHSGNNKILPLPRVSVRQAFDRIMHRKKPFGDTDRGFKDYLIWRTVLDFIQKHPNETVAFVTNNTHDFGSSDILFSDFEDDLTGIGADRNKFHFFSSVSSFYDSMILPRLSMLEEVKEQLNNGTWSEFDLERWILREADSIFEGRTLNPDYFEPGEGYTAATITSVKPPALLSVLGVAQLAPNELLIVTTARISVTVTLTAPQQEGPSAQFQRRQTHQWATSVRMLVTYETERHEVSDFEVTNYFDYEESFPGGHE